MLNHFILVVIQFNRYSLSKSLNLTIPNKNIESILKDRYRHEAPWSRTFGYIIECKKEIGHYLHVYLYKFMTEALDPPWRPVIKTS